MNVLEMRFRAGTSNILYVNVNFARSLAQRLADESGEPVTVFQVGACGAETMLQAIQPNK